MTKFKVNIYAYGDEPRISTIDITRETEHSYWTARTPDRWNKSTERLHQKRSDPVFDTFDQAKREWVAKCRGKVRDAESMIAMYQKSLADAKAVLVTAEAIQVPNGATE